MPSRPYELAQNLETLQNVAGWHAYRDGDLVTAIELASAVVKVHPNEGRTWELLGLAWRDLGKPLPAADAFERASLLVTLTPLSSLCLAECYAVLQRRRLARDLYLLQAKQLADSVDMLLLAASGLEGIDEPQLALDVCRKAGNLDPESGQVVYDMCFYAMRSGCSASLAESLAWRAVELEPDNVHFRIGLATLLVRLGHTHRACRVLQILELSDFRQVCCRCCLERIANLYQQAGSAEKAELCQLRINELELASTSNRQRIQSREQSRLEGGR